MHTFTYVSKVTYVSKLFTVYVNALTHMSINTPGENWGK